MLIIFYLENKTTGACAKGVVYESPMNNVIDRMPHTWFKKNPSGFHKHHSTWAAILKVTNDVPMDLWLCERALVLLELSPTFTLSSCNSDNSGEPHHQRPQTNFYQQWEFWFLCIASVDSPKSQKEYVHSCPPPPEKNKIDVPVALNKANNYFIQKIVHPVEIVRSKVQSKKDIDYKKKKEVSFSNAFSNMRRIPITSMLRQRVPY